jgi:acyl-CoA dehydrogenase
MRSETNEKARPDVRSIYLDDDLEAIKDQIRQYVEREVVPRVEEWEAAGAIPREQLDEMGKLGFFGLRIPEDHGGLGMGHIASVVFAEELGRSTSGGFAITVLVHTDLASPYVTNFGSVEQKMRWLPRFASGELVTAIAVTEPDAGSDVAALRATARRDGEGWRLNGTKMFITNGAVADLVFVAAKTNPDVKGSRGISIFAVEQATMGFSASRALKKMGWHSSNTAELILDDVWVPAENLIGEENGGFYYIMNNFQNERLAIMGQAIGEAQKAIELTVAHLKERHAFGAPLWEKQGIRQRVAMRQAEIDAAREMTYHAAWLTDEGEDTVRQVSEVKALVGELVNKVLYDCVQFHGGMGYIAETAVERMYRDARIHSIGGGATEVMLEEVAKRL